MPIIEFPNGERIEFPDSMSEEQINSAAGSYWSGKSKGTMGPAARFGYGAGNVARGLLQMAQKATQAVLGEPSTYEVGGEQKRLPTSAETDVALQQRQTEYEARKPAGFDYAKMAGEIAATLPLAVAGGITGAIAGGAVAGSATPTLADENGSFWAEKAQQAGLGAVGGAAGGVIGKVVGKVISGVANEPAKELLAQGITPTLGQAIGPKAAIAEEKLTSVPLLGSQIVKSRQSAIEQANVAIYNKVLAPIGQKSSGTVGPEGVAEVHQALSAAYDEIAPKITMDASRLGEDVAPAITEAADYLPKQSFDEFNRILGNAINRMEKGGYKDAESYINYFVDKAHRGTDPDKQVLGDSLEKLLMATRDSMAKQNPAFASRLKAINEGWKGYSIVRKAAFDAEKAGREAFSPEEFSRAVAGAAQRTGVKGVAAFGENRAFMQDISRPMMQVLGRKYPDSGTAGRFMAGAALGAAAGGAYSQGWVSGEQLAAGAALAVPYASPLTRSIAARALLSRPPAAAVAGRAVQAIAQGAAPGTGLVLAEAGAP